MAGIFDGNLTDVKHFDANGAPQNFTTAVTSADRVIAGAMEDIQYQVNTSALKADGTTATAGTITVLFTYKNSAGSTIDANTFPARSVVGGDVYTYRTALPMGADRVAVTVTPSSATTLGPTTAGFVLGGKRLNRAF